jgi:hypothetical protein
MQRACGHPLAESPETRDFAGRVLGDERLDIHGTSHHVECLLPVRIIQKVITGNSVALDTPPHVRPLQQTCQQTLLLRAKWSAA